MMMLVLVPVRDIVPGLTMSLVLLSVVCVCVSLFLPSLVSMPLSLWFGPVIAHLLVPVLVLALARGSVTCVRVLFLLLPPYDGSCFRDRPCYCLCSCLVRVPVHAICRFHALVLDVFLVLALVPVIVLVLVLVPVLVPVIDLAFCWK